MSPPVTAGRGLTRAIAIGALTLASVEAAGQSWRIQPSVSGELTFTDNVDLAPSATRRSDLVTVITPQLRITEKGAHSELNGTITLPISLYARTGENDRVNPEAAIFGKVELYPRVFFVDGSVQVSQEYLSPFGARPQNLVNATDNRYTAEYYRISPYLKGETLAGLSYELRDNNIWSDAGSAPVTTQSSYTNEILGNLTQAPRPLGWGVEYQRTDTKFTRQDPFVTEIARGRGSWQPDPQWELSVTAGYEDNHYPTADFSGPTYGAGVKWRPTERTNLDARWEHRFFGPSYAFTFEHRRPLSVWTLRAYRDITTYIRREE
jgi:uncharacterized protein (PEP-CTERM system associated)